MDVIGSERFGPRVICPQCGCLIENRLDQMIGVCSDLRCRGPYLAKKSREREAALRAENKAVISHTIERMRTELAPELYSVVQSCSESGRISKVPNCDESLTVLPADRTRKFTEHLKQVLQQATEIVSELRSSSSVLTEYAHRDWEGEKPPILPVLNGCTTCRGYCCRNGGDTAFLSAGQIAWQLLSDPTLTIESIEKYYRLQLPEESIDDSCVFHTAQGCSLPRKQRASICNDFHCWELQEVLANHNPGKELPWVSIASTKGTVGRVGIVAPGMERVEVECADLVVRPSSK